MQISDIQAYLEEHELDGWLLADFHARNSIMIATLNLTDHLTRRSFYWVPVEGRPVALVHAIEKAKFAEVEGEIVPYSGYRQLESELQKRLSGAKTIAMEWAANGRLPYIGLVDAGTIELIREMGLEIKSSADLVAHFTARLSAEQMAMHRMAARNLIEIKEKAFAHIAQSLESDNKITEYDVCQFIRDRFAEYDMVTSFGPNCSVDAHAGDPHYDPSETNSAEIKKGSLILIDLWAKLDQPGAVYGDITWMGFAGRKEEIPAEYVDYFDVIARARDRAVAFLRENIDKQPVYGNEVDDACRAVVESAGHGKLFTHRTGHSITTTEHGTGPNIDNLETEDRRRLQRGHLFSVEPGVYMDTCGFRTEIDVMVTHEGIEITTLPLQTEIKALF